MTRFPVAAESGTASSGHSQRTRTSSVASTLVTAAQPIWWSRSGLASVSPSSPATIRGRCAVVYATPVISTRMNAATTDR